MMSFCWGQLRLGIIPLLLGIFVASCGGDESGGNGEKIRVITTLPLFADFVREIGGDRVEVTSLVPLGADPHTFEPSPRDVEAITKADIAYANGLDLEPSLIRLLEPNLSGGASLILLGEAAVDAGAATREGGEHKDEGQGEPSSEQGGPSVDPHMWMDPANAALYVAAIRDGLSEIDPDRSASYAKSYANYTGDIDEVGNYVSSETEVVPDDLRKLVTTHDAFGYFAQAFGFEVVEFVAESPGGDPSPEDIAKIAAVLEGQGVPAVFVEPQVHEEGQILEQAADDAGVEVCVLYSDSLDDTVTSYIELMRFNADELARCLGAAGGG